MTDVLAGTPAAAWYPDPAQPELLRWWDGSSWSVHTMAHPDVAPAIEDQVPVPAPAALAPDPVPPVLHAVPAQQIPEPMPFANGVSLGAGGPELYTEPPVLGPIERAARAEIYAKLASSHAKETVAAAAKPPGSDPFGSFSNSSSPTKWAAPTARTTPEYDGPAPSSTLGAWLLAVVSPWLLIGGNLLIIFVLLKTPAPLVAIIVVYVLAIILPFFFAQMDRVGLRGRGHTKRPSGWWMLLSTLVYFIVRTVKLSPRSSAAFVPLVVFIVSSVLSSAAIYVVAPAAAADVDKFVVIQSLTTLDTQLAAELQAQTGDTYQVECPEGVLPPFSCQAVAPNGSSIDIHVTLVDGRLVFT